MQTMALKYIFLTIAPLLMVASCARAPEPIARDLSDELDTLLVTGFSDIQDYYISDTNITDLALSGLRNIDKSFKEINFIENDRSIIFNVNYETIAKTILPEDQNDVEELAFILAQFLEDTKEASSQIGSQSDDVLIDILFDGILEPLDKFSRYAGPSQASTERDSREGFGGIGVILGDHTKGALITVVNVGDPAEAAGIHQGDIITAIDQQSVAGKSIEHISQLLRGPEDQSINVNILRPGIEDPQEMIVGRDRIVPNTVFYSIEDGYPIIRISSFNQRTAKRIAEAVSVAAYDDKVTQGGLIIDLRNNPGGLLDQAVDTADLFLNSGVISQIDGRNPLSDQLFFAENGDISAGAPIVVLINGASASAAEILAAALQDHERAVILGSNSFGKGSVQTVLSMPNTGELILTWAHFQSPHNYPLNEFGILPNLCTAKLDSDWLSDTSTISDQMVDSKKMYDDSRIKLRDITPSITDFRRLCQWQGPSKNDVDMKAAIYLLGNVNLYKSALHTGDER